MLKTQELLQQLTTVVKANSHEISVLHERLTAESQNAESRRIDLARHQTQLDHLTADLLQVERHQQYNISPKIDKITEIIQSIHTAVIAPTPDLPDVDDSHVY